MNPLQRDPPLFYPDDCYRCHREVVEPCYPRMYLCPECEIQTRSTFLVPLLRQFLKREPDHLLVENIAQFAAVYRIRRKRIYFVREVLNTWMWQQGERKMLDPSAWQHGRVSPVEVFVVNVVAHKEDILNRIMNCL